MEAVNGPKGRSGGGAYETWIAAFVEVEPEGGFRTVVKQVWSRTRVASNDAAAPGSVVNGLGAIAPVYGRKRRSIVNGVPETWMDGFVTREPEGGIRDVVKLA